MGLGFIGLGNIGAPMARRLAQQGGDVWLFDAIPAAMAPFADCARLAGSVREVARRCSQVGICVRDEADVRGVLDGDDGLLANLAPGAAIAVHSTIGIDALLDFARQAQARAITLVDAAVTGGADVAARGALTCMLGGPDGIADRLAPLLGPYCRQIVHAGPVGAGMKLKVANNLVTYTQLAVGVEAMRLVRLSGVEPEMLLEVMRSNGNLTPAMAAYLAARESGIAAAAKDEFAAFQRGLAGLAEKDLDSALATGDASGLPLPLGAAVRGLFRTTVERIDD